MEIFYSLFILHLLCCLALQMVTFIAEKVVRVLGSLSYITGKAEKRKRKEERLLSQMKKQKDKETKEAESKKRKLEEEKEQQLKGEE